MQKLFSYLHTFYDYEIKIYNLTSFLTITQNNPTFKEEYRTEFKYFQYSTHVNYRFLKGIKIT